VAESAVAEFTAGVRAVTALGAGMLFLAGAIGTDATAWRDLLLIFVVWFAMFDWDRGIRPLHRVHGMLP
jgi:hypothetical protein